MEQAEVAPGAREIGPGAQRGVERVQRRRGIAVARARHAEVVPRQRVGGIGVDRLAIRAARLLAPPGLVQADAPLVPQLGIAGLPLEQPVVELDRRAEVLPQQVGLGHRLERGGLVLAGLERQPALPQRLGEIASLAKRHREAQVRLERARLPRAGGSLASPGEPARSGAALGPDQEVGLGGAERGIERDGAAGGRPGRLVMPEVSIEETQDVVHLGVVGIEPDRLGENWSAPCR